MLHSIFSAGSLHELILSKFQMSSLIDFDSNLGFFNMN